jgi:hypothetical protein
MTMINKDEGEPRHRQHEPPELRVVRRDRDDTGSPVGEHDQQARGDQRDPQMAQGGVLAPDQVQQVANGHRQLRSQRNPAPADRRGGEGISGSGPECTWQPMPLYPTLIFSPYPVISR